MSDKRFKLYCVESTEVVRRKEIGWQDCHDWCDCFVLTAGTLIVPRGDGGLE